ncbi:hypothetical protein A6P54_13115 [Bacillus sp. MKU004]|nr:hypothetical protein A6P54_13115 [Bacillus sp. MKU004]
MRKITKGVIFAVIYALLVAVLPQDLSIQVAKAADDLKKIEMDHSYYVLDAALYTDTAFLVGREYIEGEVGPLQVLAKNRNGKTTELITAKELEDKGISIIGDTENYLYLNARASKNKTITVDDLYKINKKTLTVEKGSREQIFKTFYTALIEKGYVVDALTPVFKAHFGSQELEWLVFRFNPDDIQKTAGKTILVNKNGNVIEYVDQLNQFGYYTSNMWYNLHSSKNGDLYYYQYITNTHSFIKINPDGSEITYQLPTEDGNYLDPTAIDSQNRLFFSGYDNEDYYFKIYQLGENGEVEQLEDITQPSQTYQDYSGKIWFREPSGDGEGYVSGYYKEDLSKVATHTDQLDRWLSLTAYGNSILLYNSQGYGASLEAPENKVGWVRENNNWFYYTAEGKATGWIRDQGLWYFLDSNGAMQAGWLKDGSEWFYLQSSGAMATGWKEVGGKWYFLNESSGEMKTGWLKDGDKWYLLQTSGAMVTGWSKSGSEWYFMNYSGEMETGWVKDNGKWYYLSASGAMATGWITVSGKWYYLYSNGAMAYNTTIDGYKLGSSGAWIK